MKYEVLDIRIPYDGTRNNMLQHVYEGMRFQYAADKAAGGGKDFDPPPTLFLAVTGDKMRIVLFEDHEELRAQLGALCNQYEASCYVIANPVWAVPIGAMNKVEGILFEYDKGDEKQLFFAELLRSSPEIFSQPYACPEEAQHVPSGTLSKIIHQEGGLAIWEQSPTSKVTQH